MNYHNSSKEVLAFFYPINLILLSLEFDWIFIQGSCPFRKYTVKYPKLSKSLDLLCVILLWAQMGQNLYQWKHITLPWCTYYILISLFLYMFPLNEILLCKSKINQVNFLIIYSRHEILRFDISVGILILVKEFQTICGLFHEHQHCLQWKPFRFCVLKNLIQILPQ